MTWPRATDVGIDTENCGLRPLFLLLLLLLLLPRYGSQIFQAPFYSIWPDCRGMIQTKVSGNRHTLLTQLLLPSLLPHSFFVRNGLGVPASSSSSVDGDEHWLSLKSVSSRNVSWTWWSANGCQMFASNWKNKVSISVAVRELCQCAAPWFKCSANEVYCFWQPLAKCLWVCCTHS